MSGDSAACGQRTAAVATVPSNDDRSFVLDVQGPAGHAKFPMALHAEVRVGRAGTCELRVDDVKLSRHHFTVRTAIGIEIVDAGSLNGTRVRGRRLDAGVPARILPGEIFEAGESRFAVEGSSVRLGTGPSVRSMEQLTAAITRIAQGDISVLILGETGAGKEHLARAIHAASPRTSGPFVPIHCGAIAPQLLESELFGHERGAFTGAVASKPGLIESASGGTVFLDEIGEMPPPLQVKLLRILETGEATRVGATTPSRLNVRFLTATNGDIEADVEQLRFRKDLFFRIAGVTLRVPPLRDRLTEIPSLAARFLREARSRQNLSPDGELSPEALSSLERHAWPGNVRELRSVIDRAVLFAGSGRIETEHVMLGEDPAVSRGHARPPRHDASLKGHLREEERRRILDALEKRQGNQSRAAELLGMPRRTLVERLRAYGLTKPRHS